MTALQVRKVRCAIYTRKSSEEGLDQDFNSLDAQREACAAYIRSQASEGWIALPDQYDDGGVSGGTLERPGLQRLLIDIEAGKVDIIVFYKVDRLSRSLFDFAKLTETFEKTGTSFVSVTQPINTTTSMGRLTLNMLLSFAQFEREVTAERIRDKIHASKAKGMWMGGTVPMGYAPDGRTLRIVDDDAKVVRSIFERYLTLGNVRLLVEQFLREGVRVPTRTRSNGTAMGGGFFTRGQLHFILKNRIYIGEIPHRTKSYPGLHPALIDRDLWDRVQAKLAEQVQGSSNPIRLRAEHLLAGKIVDQAGETLVATHARKGNVRYRYYVSRSLHLGNSTDGMRVPAREIETLICQRLTRIFEDPIEIISAFGVDVAATDIRTLASKAATIVARIRAKDRALLQMVVSKVSVLPGAVEIDCDRAQLAELLEIEMGNVDVSPLVANARLTRSGLAMRFIQNGERTAPEPDGALIRLLVQARRYWLELRKGERSVTEFAATEGVSPSWITRVARIAFLSPAIVETILAGKQPPTMTAQSLILGDAVNRCWKQQKLTLIG